MVRPYTVHHHERTAYPNGETNTVNRESIQNVQRAFITYRETEPVPRGIPEIPHIHKEHAAYDFHAIVDNSGNTPAEDVVGLFRVGDLPNGASEQDFMPTGWAVVRTTIGPKGNGQIGFDVETDEFVFGQEFTVLIHP